ncbi:MAG: gliding motility-associated C-terminal domain-containing protein [Bacteroidetes bacterium]|nr:gliding motility-associated C-terminal domain-containing protein [Bacteroidota bacterium]
MMRDSPGNIHKTILLAILWLSLAQVHAITTSVNTTTSICFNDGTLTLNSTGGTAPYTYTITSGPAIPGVTYPYTLPPGQNTFSNLAAGSYTGTVRDALGATGTFTATVGGTYTFPTMQIDTPTAPWLLPPVLQCTASGGVPPYQYAISTTGSNSGFGLYQNSPVFAHICPSTYWVRVKDACGNIFTDITHFNYPIAAVTSCVNYSRGSLQMTSPDANLPVTYTCYNTRTGLSYSNQTGIFTNLGSSDSLRVTLTDSCGVSTGLKLERPVQRFVTNCPYDGNIYGHVDYGDTATMTCTSCSPIQTVTLTGSGSGPYLDTIFQHVPAGVTPQIVVVHSSHSSCGRDTSIPLFIAPIVDFMQLTTPDCHSIQATVYSGSLGGIPSVDSFVLKGGTGAVLQSNTTGLFTSLPNDYYTVVAHLHAGQCPDSLAVQIALPAMGVGCFTLMKDSLCNDRWEVSVNPTPPEIYSIVSAAGDTVRAASSPGYFDKFFYNLIPTATYSLISTGGCAVPITTPPLDLPVPLISSYAPCNGPPIVKYIFPNYIHCIPELNLKIWLADSLVVDTSLSTVLTPWQVSVHVPDSGLYHYEVYMKPQVPVTPLRYDSICPLDSGSIYVISDHIPRLAPANINICDSNSTDSLHFHIAGGLPPYTVEIPGLDTVQVLDDTGVFPSHHPGTYTMIVYDDCGVSRSLSLSVIDTCHGCPIAAIHASDTLVCLGDTIDLYDISAGGVVNEWQVDGIPTNPGTHIIYVPAAGVHDVTLISGAVSGCVDTADVFIRAVAPTSLDIGGDTVYCDAFSRVISTGIAGTAWSTGVTAAQITVQQPGLYIATVSDVCGTHQDSISIFSHAIRGLVLSADSFTICSNRTDSLLLTAAVDSQSGRPVVLTWNTGYQTTGTYSASIWAHASGSYQVTASDGQCAATAAVPITAIVCDTICYPCDTGCHPCDTTCTTCPDTGCISRVALPDIFSPNGDSRNDSFYIPHLCPVYGYTMRIYNRWGQLVFESGDINMGWDGTYRGKPQPSETYTCFMCYQGQPSDPVQCHQWAVTLVR